MLLRAAGAWAPDGPASELLEAEPASALVFGGYSAGSPEHWPRLPVGQRRAYDAARAQG